MEKQMNQFSIYKLTFQDGSESEQQFNGYLQFKNDEISQMITKAELIKQWEEEVVEPVAVEIEADKVEEVEDELVQEQE